MRRRCKSCGKEERRSMLIQHSKIPFQQGESLWTACGVAVSIVWLTAFSSGGCSANHAGSVASGPALSVTALSNVLLVDLSCRRL